MEFLDVQSAPAVVILRDAAAVARATTTMGARSMKRRDFCGMGVAGGGATLLPVGPLPAGAAPLSPGLGLRAAKQAGAETTIERAAVQAWRASLSGTLLSPGEEGYESARHVWN